ncbi:MAG TPA: flagellar hook protein FlgE [Polyangiales bacterium]|nr:flagellar hook protein FlgE [Polyangiales bacterium]
MSILRTLNTGATGLTANGEALGVVSDNIANANTIGFKRSRADFQDMVASAGKNELTQVGAGSRVGKVETMWKQGALLSTDASTDLALSGEGFFVVKGTASGVDGNFYSRAGQFHLDKDGYVTNVDNLKLQGYQADARGNILGTLGDLRVGPTALPATKSSAINLGVNLDVRASVPAAAFDVNNLAGSTNTSTSLTTYDSLGNAHQITTYFTKTGTNTWDFHALADGNEIEGGTAGVPFEGASGTLTFNTDGALQTELTNSSTWNFKGATAGQEISFDFGTSLDEGGTGLDGTTNFANAFTTNAATQDGYAAGSVTGINVSATGNITGVFTNGQRRTLGQVAVANFKSTDGLTRTGQGLYVQTEDSGEPLLGTASTGGRGAIVSGSLEQSNVDIGKEFVDLITFQRGFQANSKIITTADEMYGELVNMKR